MASELLHIDYNNLENKPTLDDIPDGEIRKLNDIDVSDIIKREEKGAPNGVVPLNDNSIIPDNFISEKFENVKGYGDINSFPETGQVDTIYIDISTNISYRWNGSDYINISVDGVIEEHLNNIENPHKVTKEQIGLSDVENKKYIFLKLTVGNNNQTDFTLPYSNLQADLISVGSVNILDFTINDDILTIPNTEIQLLKDEVVFGYFYTINEEE